MGFVGASSVTTPSMLGAARPIRRALIGAALAWIGATAAYAAAPPMMAVPGQMNVSAAGAFTYSVPIVVPPGTAGMGPALALDYSSQNGDGPEGIGWALTGMPAITRCPRTIAQDGIHGGVNFDANDRFCMEGQRLVLVSGTYGADGSEYRTEIDTYSRILAHGAAGSGPSWFEVHTKAGQIIELGNTADSRVLPVKADGSGTMPTARAWAVDRISDTKGNFLTVSYINDTANGQVYPLAVHYTGNAGAGLAPYNSVQFIYGSRPDMVPSYQAGSVMKTTVLLSDIQTYAGANLVLDYKLTYRPAGSAATHDELLSVTQCDGAATPQCLAPITFGWQGSRDTLTYSAMPNHTAEWAYKGLGVPSLAPGDFNGDGLTDFVVLGVPAIGPATCPPTQGGPFYFATPSGAFTPGALQITSLDYYGTPSTAPFCPPGAAYPGAGSVGTVDFNGDGIGDLAVSGQVVNDVYLLPDISTGSAFYSDFSVSRQMQPGQLADMDGDGRTDFIYSNGFLADVSLSNGDGSFRAGPAYNSFTGFSLAADFDGDGCADLLGGNYPNVTKIQFSCNPATATMQTTALTMPTDGGAMRWQTGDFNGDGKTDLIDGAGHLFLSTGTGFVATGFTAPASWSQMYVADFNGDGKADVLAVLPDGSGYGVYLSTGAGFTLAATIPVTSATPVIADWNNDGAADVWMQTASGDTEYLFHYVPELMTTVSNGLGASTTATYGKLNDPTVYTKGSGAAYPIQDMIGAQYVVSRVQSSDGVGGLYTTLYTYAGAKTDLSGRGFMGFSQVTVSDPQLATAQTTNYRMDFPFTGEVASQTKVWSPPGGAPVTLSSVTNTYQTDPACAGAAQTAPPYTVEHCTSAAQSSDTDGSPFPSVTTANTYDAYGNVLTSVASVSDGSSKTTTNTYLNDTTNWFLGRLLTSAVQSVVAGSTLTRHASYAYDPASGLVTAQIVEPQDSGALRLETDTAYDAFGNKQVVTASGLAAGASGLAAQARPTTATFDARGQFATTIANALGESETWSYNADFGTPASHTGPNGVATTWAYDTFGRPLRETRADGTQTLDADVYCANVNGGSAACPTNGAYYVDTRPVAADGVTANGAETRSYYDTLSRVIAADTAAFDTSAAAWIRGDTLYDGFGRVAQASRPYLLGVDAPVWTVSSYADASGRNDPLARAWSVTAPDGSVTTFTYDALTTSVTNANLATTTTVKNAQGLIARVTDALGQPTTYSYDAFADMTTANPPGTAIVRYTYDLRGRKLSASDSDMGTWTYSYDAFGALASQTDAKGQTSTMAYDALGRLVSRSEPDMVSSWSYGTSAAHHNIDQLLSASCTGAACVSGYTRSYLYDSLARLARTTIAVNGASYYTIPTYDPVTGKLASLRNFSGFTVNYTYTARGYLSTIADASTPSLVYWTANARNAEMQLTQSTAGNGVTTFDSYDPLTGRMLNVCATPNASACDGADANISTTFDPVGNLTSRGDTLHGVTESFAYDPLNRLTTSTLANGGAPVTRTTAYNSAGSITKKSDVCNTTNCFAYTGTAPHALSSIAGTYEGIANPNFYYDPNGNMICVTTLTACDASAAKAVTWTSFNMVSSVKEGTTTVSLTYDSEHARAQQIEAEGATLYMNDASLGAMAERFQPTTGAVTWRNYILADGKIVAERTSTGATVKVRYFVLDHLGSTVALTDETAHLVESDAYDAWGKQRNATTGGDDTTCSLPATSFSNRGFTGHEEMHDGLCLTNMNARIYDPTIGRFMSPDDVIPDLYNGQSYNRYTYVDDNPLSYTDPTGHDADNGYHPYTAEDANRNNPSCTGDCDSDQDRAIAQGLKNQATEGAIGAAFAALTGTNPSGIHVTYQGGGFYTATAPGYTFASGDGSVVGGDTFAFSENDGGQSLAIQIKADNADVGSAKFESGQASGASSQSVTSTGDGAPSVSLSRAQAQYTSNRYIYADDEYGKQAKTVPDDPRGFLIFAHGIDGQEGRLFKNLTTDHTGIDAMDLARQIQANPKQFGYTQGQDIVLAVCYAGQGGVNSTASTFANTLQVKVWASQFVVGITPPPVRLISGEPVSQVGTAMGMAIHQMYNRPWVQFPLPPEKP